MKVWEHRIGMRPITHSVYHTTTLPVGCAGANLLSRDCGQTVNATQRELPRKERRSKRDAPGLGGLGGALTQAIGASFWTDGYPVRIIDSQFAYKSRLREICNSASANTSVPLPTQWVFNQRAKNSVLAAAISAAQSLKPKTLAGEKKSLAGEGPSPASHASHAHLPISKRCAEVLWRFSGCVVGLCAARTFRNLRYHMGDFCARLTLGICPSTKHGAPRNHARLRWAREKTRTITRPAGRRGDH
jgi:hypothetical protein